MSFFELSLCDYKNEENTNFFKRDVFVETLLYDLSKNNSDIGPDINNLICKFNEIKKVFEEPIDGAYEEIIYEQISGLRSSLMIEATENKDNIDGRIKSLNTDLQQQIDDCMDLSNKVYELQENAVLYKNFISSLTKELSDTENDVDNDVAGTLAFLRKLIIAIRNKAENISQTNDLNINDTLKTYENEKSFELTKEGFDSEFTVDVSKNMLEDLEGLDWKDHEKIDLLIQNSVFIFMKYVLMKMDCSKNPEIECQLTKIFSDYGDALADKLRKMPRFSGDLDTTCAFEKIEQDIQLETDIARVTSENNCLKAEIEEMVQAKKRSDSLVSTLELRITSLTTELQATNTNFKMSHSRSDRLESNSLIDSLDLNEIKSTSENLEKSEEIKATENSPTKFSERILSFRSDMEECVQTNDDTIIESLRLEIADLTLRMQSSSDNLKMWQSRSEELENINESLKSELVTIKDQFQGLENENENILKERDTKNAFISGLELEGIRLTSELAFVADNLKKMQCQSDELKATNIALERSLSMSNDQNQSKLESLQMKDDSDSVTESLQLEVVKLTSELQSTKENYEKSQSHSKELESSLVLLGNQIESLKIDIEEIQIDYESCQINLELSNEASKKLSTDLMNSNNQTESIKGEYLIRIQEMEQKICDILLENEQLKDADVLKVLEDEVEVLKASLSDVTQEKVFIALKLSAAKAESEEANKILYENENNVIEKEKIIKLLEGQIKNLQMSLDSLNLELDASIEDCIRVNEELDSVTSALQEKNDQYIHACSLLETSQIQLKVICDEKKAIEIDLQNSVVNLEKKSLEQTKFIEEYQARIAIIEEENSHFKEVDAARVNLQKKSEALEIENDKIQISLNSFQDEKIEMKNRIDYLETMCSSTAETIKSLNDQIEREETENQLNKAKISALEIKIESERSSLKDHLDNATNLLSDMTNKFNDREEKLADLLVKSGEQMERIEADNKKIEDCESELCVERSTIGRLMNELKEKENQLSDNESELSRCRKEIEKIKEQEDLLKNAEDSVENLKKELLSKDKEMRACKTEIESLRKLQTILNDDREKLQQCEKQLAAKEFDSRSLTNRLKEKEKDNEVLSKKAQEAFQNQQRAVTKFKKILSEFEEYKSQHLNVDGLQASINPTQEEIDVLKLELLKKTEELGQVTKESDDTLAAYNTLKQNYLGKRKRTEELNAKYEKLLKFCQDNNIVYPR